MGKPGRKKRKTFTSRAGATDYEFVIEKIDQEQEKLFVHGYCDAPTDPDPKIVVTTEQGQRDALNTACHEILHAMFWNKREDWIKNRADQMSEALWKMGVRIPNWPKK